MKVFLSSTAQDLVAYRRVADDTILRLSQQSVAMERFGPLPGAPVEECEQKARESDLVVCIVAHRYGFVPEKGRGSITRREAEAAIAAGKDVLVWMVADDHPWTEKKEQDLLTDPSVLADPARVAEVAAGVQALLDFKAWLRATFVCDTFTTPDELGRKIAVALPNHFAKQPAGATPAKPKQGEIRIVHALQPAPHFHGRDALVRELTEWVAQTAATATPASTTSARRPRWPCCADGAWSATRRRSVPRAQVGYHALSVAVIGSYLRSFANGRIEEVTSFDLDAVTGEDPKAAKLARVLAFYAERLPPEERELLARLSVFPRGVTLELLGTLIDAGGEVAGLLVKAKPRLVMLLNGLKARGLVFEYRSETSVTWTAHPFLREKFRGLLGCPAEKVFDVVAREFGAGLEEQPARKPSPHFSPPPCCDRRSARSGGPFARKPGSTQCQLRLRRLSVRAAPETGASAASRRAVVRNAR